MFGLIKAPQGCSNTDNDLYNNHRQHYCGTCKTIGQNYGQSARMMLNFDVVFLAELLSLTANDDRTQWQPALQQVNTCFSMPKQDTPPSLALQYAAATNLLFTELKAKDQIADTKKKRWKIFQAYFSPSFLKAKKQLETWQVDTQQIIQLAKQQEQLEKRTPSQAQNIEEFINYYATPTATITALIFEQGANCIGKNEFNASFYELGYAYGQLVYTLDAFNDLEADLHHKAFNPIALFYQHKLSLATKGLEVVRDHILHLQEQITLLLKALPMEEEQQSSFAARLTSSLVLDLYKERPVYHSTIHRLKHRWATAKKQVDHFFCHSSKGLLQLRYYLMIFAVFISPEATEQILPVESKAMVFSWVALITAFLGILGFSLS